MSSPQLIINEPKFSAGVEQTPQGLSVLLSGVLNENIDLAPLEQHLLSSAKAGIDSVTFNMDQLSYINSVGIKNWLIFLKNVNDAMNCSFVLVPEIVIDQAGVVPKMLGKQGSHVRSFKAPFICENCDNAPALVLTPDDVKKEGDQWNPPQRNCDKCGSEMEFDGVPDEYFHFLGEYGK